MNDLKIFCQKWLNQKSKNLSEEKNPPELLPYSVILGTKSFVENYYFDRQKLADKKSTPSINIPFPSKDGTIIGALRLSDAFFV